MTIDTNDNIREDENIFAEIRVDDDIDYYSSYKKQLVSSKPPHPDKTRADLTKWLLALLTTLLILPCIVILLYKVKPIEDLLEFVKWGIGIVSPIFGTAMGFYFGGKLRTAEDWNNEK